MPRNLSPLLFLLLFLSGCATFNNLLGTSDKEASKQTAETQAPLPPASERQTQPVVCNCPTPAESVRSKASKVTSAVDKNRSKEQIQLVQEVLKSSGYNPGPIDGILGPKTKSALRQYQSGCAMLDDLLRTSDKELFQQTAETPRKVTSPINKNPGKEKIRLVQERLKSSGYNPGPIDGILGPKTKSALRSYQASHGLSNSGTPDDKTLLSLGAG